MSMDRLYSELQQFIHALDRFNESTGRNWDELQRAFDSAHDLWNEAATRREFESQWSELGTALRMYRQKHGERYLEFLVQRKWSLDRYFGRR